MEKAINISTKFAVGDTVYFISQSDIIKSKVREIRIEVKLTKEATYIEKPSYRLEQSEVREYLDDRKGDQLFATPEEAADSVKKEMLSRFNDTFTN